MCSSPTPWISSADGILVSCDVFLCPVWLSCKSVVRPKGLIGCGFYFLGFENLGTLLLRHGCGPFSGGGSVCGPLVRLRPFISM